MSAIYNIVFYILLLQIFHSVCHIADVLIDLQQYGHNKYIGWILRFPCSLPGVVNELEKLLKEMNHDLEDWKRSVAEARKSYYSLNYFTAQQLLLLRKELWYYKDPDYCGTLKPEVIALLQCLSQDINPDLVIIQIRKECWDKNIEKMEVIHSQIINDVTTTPSSSVTYSSLSKSQEIPRTKQVLKTPLSGPQPQLTGSELTDKQQAILANLTESHGFHKKLILLAFEACAAPDVEEAVMKWCGLQNEINFDSDNESEPFSDEQECSDTDSEQEYSDEEQQSNEVIPFQSNHILFENHPVIREPVLAGNLMDLSKRAPEQYAIEYNEYGQSVEIKHHIVESEVEYVQKFNSEPTKYDLLHRIYSHA